MRNGASMMARYGGRGGGTVSGAIPFNSRVGAQPAASQSLMPGGATAPFAVATFVFGVELL